MLKTTQKKLIWVEILIWEYAKRIQLWFGGTQRGKMLICGHASIKSLRTPGLHYFDVNFLLYEKVLYDHLLLEEKICFCPNDRKLYSYKLKHWKYCSLHRSAVLNLGYASSSQGVHKMFKTTQKKHIWIEILTWGYAERIQLWFVGYPEGKNFDLWAREYQKFENPWFTLSFVWKGSLWSPLV